MPAPPPFVLPAESWRTRLAGLLAGAGRQSAAVALVVLLALGAAGVLWLRGGAQPAGAAAPAGGSGAPAAGPGAAGPGATLPAVPPGGSATVGTGGGMVAVHVAGRVRRPAVVELPPGSRVMDAITAAGGVTAGADLDAVNLARKLVDGEQIRVAARGEHPTPPPGAPDQGATVPGALVDLNSASAEQLDALPGVGQVTAARIIAYRQAHPFRSVEELRQVDGIGDRRFAQLEDLVTVG